eukprot:TRINITY_DN65877_c3_g1_i1.p1 TRINITY_DN65877_c3_g1~~TRINITY_DN65877_c3_g1_i1.p1  ORF type:complete len:374 (+),score=217.42 TRINITY_DN65877_c3_g1_i1:68-1123(+)
MKDEEADESPKQAAGDDEKPQRQEKEKKQKKKKRWFWQRSKSDADIATTETENNNSNADELEVKVESKESKDNNNNMNNNDNKKSSAPQRLWSLKPTRKTDDHVFHISSAKHMGKNNRGNHRTVFYLKLRTKRGVERTIPKMYSHFREFDNGWHQLYPSLHVKYTLPRLLMGKKKLDDKHIELLRLNLERYIQGVSTVPDLAPQIANFIGVKLKFWEPASEFYELHNDWHGDPNKAVAIGEERRGSNAGHQRGWSQDYDVGNKQRKKNNKKNGKNKKKGDARQRDAEETAQRLSLDDGSGGKKRSGLLGWLFGGDKNKKQNKKKKDEEDETKKQVNKPTTKNKKKEPIPTH